MALILPGIVVAHTHLYSVLARGMPAPIDRPTNFIEILQRVWWRLDRALDLDGLRASARVGIADAIRSGTTCLIDHHESPRFIAGSLDVIADELQTAGLRGVVCYGVTARNEGEKEWRAGLNENERFLGNNRRPLVRSMVGLHACFTLPDEAISEAAAMARAFGVGLHVHVAEGEVDAGAVRRLEKLNALVPNSIYAHCVHTTPEERKLLVDSGGWIVHNPRSNMGNRVGYARLSDVEGRVAIGTDGWDADMFAEMKALAIKAGEENDKVDLRRRFATGRAIVDALYGEPVCGVRGGDRVELDYEAPTPMIDDNMMGHLLSGAPRVKGVWVAGKKIEPDGIPVEARRHAAKLWLRMQEVL